MQLEGIKDTVEWQKPEIMSIVLYFRALVYLNVINIHYLYLIMSNFKIVTKMLLLGSFSFELFLLVS